MRVRTPTLVLLAAPALLVAGCQAGDETNENAGNSIASSNSVDAADVPDRTLAQTVGETGDHSTLSQAIKAAGLEATMAGSQPYTLFAPTNAAFQKLPAGAAEELMQPDSRAELTAILTYHIVPGVVMAGDLAKAIASGDGKTEIATVGGGTLTATQEGDAIVITDGQGGKVRIAQADILAANGVVHVVDGVLMPGQPGPAPAQ